MIRMTARTKTSACDNGMPYMNNRSRCSEQGPAVLIAPLAARGLLKHDRENASPTFAAHPVADGGDLAQIWQRVAGRDLMPEKGGP
jgi:hypothetical protein